MARRVTFPFEPRPSRVFGLVHRPMAVVDLWSRRYRDWYPVAFLVDTGADCSLLPREFLGELGVRPARGCRPVQGSGIGGREPVLLARRWRLRLGPWIRQAPIGFISRPGLPPVLGRMGFRDAFNVTVFRRRTTFAGR